MKELMQILLKWPDELKEAFASRFMECVVNLGHYTLKSKTWKQY